MSKRQKVVWYEGMSLDPHHFQQWDRFQKSALDSRIQSLAYFNWGLLDIAIDKVALTNGQYNLLRCKGISPDGLIFDIPDNDPVPHSRNIKSIFSPTENELSVFLAIPTEQEGSSNCRVEGDSDKRDTRYTLKNITVNDDNTGTDERQIGIGSTNFQLRFGNESLEKFSTLKIAEIVRASDGSFTLSDKFIPSSLAIEASENLLSITRRLLELLIAKRSSLGGKKSFTGKGEYAARDITVFLILQTLNTFIPLLTHFHTMSKTHPVELYMRLLALAGQLTTFSPDADVDPHNFPNYDHDNPSKCFGQLDDVIRMLLDSITFAALYISIPLEKKSESLYFGYVSDPSLFKESKFFLIIKGDIPEDEMIKEIPINIRVASPDTINNVVSSYIKGLAIKHISVPPHELPKQEGAQCFQLEPFGKFWEAICKSKSLAIYIPNRLRSINIEAVAIK